MQFRFQLCPISSLKLALPVLRPAKKAIITLLEDNPLDYQEKVGIQ